MNNGAAAELVGMARRWAELATLDALIAVNEGDDSGLAKSLLEGDDGLYARRGSLRLQLIAAELAS